MSTPSKVILITGASAGMGLETACALAREGHIVYGVARRVERMQALKSVGGRPMALDVTDETQVRAVVEHILQEVGRIDVLINNAGFGLYGAVEDIPLSEARYQFEVNLFGVAALTRAVLPSMRAQKKGRIVNITSMGGKIYTPLGAWYHASKHALEGFSDCLRLETEPFGIEVVIIEPGMIATEFGDVLTGPMLERSGNGPYAPMAHAVAQAVRASAKNNGSSPASVVVEAITTALRASRPKTRYVIGKLARPLLFLRRWLSDRMFDKVVMSEVKRLA